MNENTVKKWIAKAESDLKIAKDEMQLTDPATDAVCFHTQQFVEKYLKAFLIFHGEPLKRTHDITTLIDECAKIDPDFEKLYEFDADELTNYAVEVRYGDVFYFPSEEEAKKAIEIAEKVKRFVLEKLGAKGFDVRIEQILKEVRDELSQK